MKRFIHLNESEFRNLIKKVIREAEEKEKSTDNEEDKNSFLICSEDFKDFDAIKDIIYELNGWYNKESDGVYRVECETKEDMYTLKRILSSFKKDSLNTRFVHGHKVNAYLDYPNDVLNKEQELDDIDFDF